MRFTQLYRILYTYKQMEHNRANWDPAATKKFMDLCIAEKNIMNFNNKGPTRQGWHNLYVNFKEKTSLNYDSKQLQNKLTTFRSFTQWRDLQNQSGLGRDKNTGGVTTDPTFWTPEQGVHSITISIVLV